MKKISVFFFVLAVLGMNFTLFADDDDDDKLKLAVMEFEDQSGDFSEKTLSNATEYIRSAFVASNKFIVIAKERQEKEMIKQMKEASYQDCNDKNCQIPLGQALSADTILRTTITFLGGIYKITSELVDLAKEATIRGAEQKFNDHDEKSLVKALDRIVLQIMGNALFYNIETMETQAIPDVKLGGVELGTMPEIEVKDANFDRVQNTYTVSELDANVGISLDADLEDLQILVLYDKCVKADRDGEKAPQNAISLWSQLAEIEENNPYQQQAVQRVSDWKKFVYSKQMAVLFEKAKVADKAGMIFPEKAMDAWDDVSKRKGADPSLNFDNPYLETARERIHFWSQYKEQIRIYKVQLQKFEEKRKQDIEKLKTILPLEVVKDAQKRTYLVQYMEIYSPFYGIDDVDDIIDSFDDATAKYLYALLHNDYLKKEMSEKCGKGNGAACYISASLTEVEDSQKANEFFAQSCEKGVISACVKAGNVYLKNNNFKDAEKLFYKACGMDSPEGCHFAAFVTERKFELEDNLILAGAIYKKACELGYSVSCKQAKDLDGLTPYKAKEKKLKIQQDEERRKAAEEKRRAREEKARRDKEMIEELNQAGRKTRLTIATTTLVSGVVVGILGGVSFYGMNNAEEDRKNYYDKYLDATGSDADKYRKKAKDADKKRKTYAVLGGVGIGIGVALITTGIVFYSINFDSEKEVKKKYNVSFGANPADGTLQFALNW